MLDYMIMGGILLFLLAMLAFGMHYRSEGNDDFFDKHNSKAMRGFWCLIVILVHIPQAYQNPIQDMMGSFAYIGVTFFFMTSAYGLSAGISRKPDSIRRFWITRLPKLILPNWIVNTVFTLLFLALFSKSTSIGGLVAINGWVKWLLYCYIAFWIGYYFHWKDTCRRPIVCICIVLLSLCIYVLGRIGTVTATTWCTEVIGFIWGMILFSQYDKIKGFFLQKWAVKASTACMLSLTLGISYLLFKHIFFWGDYVLKILLGLSILCFILILNVKVSIGNKVSCFLGDISFEVYLSHGFVFQIIEKLLPGIPSGMFIALSILATLCVSFLIHNLCTLCLKKLGM